MSLGRKILIAVAAAIVVAVLIPVVRHYQLRWATEAYIAQLKAEGEPMDLAQVVPPPVPPEQNSADTFRQAAALLMADEDWWSTNTVGGMKMVAPGKAMVVWQQPNVWEYHYTNSWEDIAAVLHRKEKTFALLWQIIGKPDFDFQIHYERGLDDLGIFTNLYLMESKRAAQELSTAVIFDLHGGDTASAVENERAMLALAQAMRDERLLISELVRIAITQIAVGPTWELLQSPNLTDAQLAQLQQDWTALDFVQSEENALEMERVAGGITTTGERRSSAQLKGEFQYMGENEFSSERILMWRYWWSYPDELRALKGWQVLITSIRMVETNGSFQDALQFQQQKLDKLGIMKLLSSGDDFMPGNMDLHTMQSQSIANLSAVIRRVMAVEAARNMAITAIALKRYQLKYGSYPADLQAMVPEFLTAVPLDPMDPVDGQALRYHSKANGTYLLYSVGENGKDDGGNPHLEQSVEGSSFYWLNHHALDWVWPQPATAKEMENYYAHPPR